MNCTALRSRQHFANYIHLINETTKGNFSLVRACKADVCTALWGSGNPDISGIGVSACLLFELKFTWNYIEERNYL